MTASPSTAPPPAADASPEDFRMTIGEHLDELRGRLLKGLAGMVVGILIALPLGKQILAFICRPLVSALQAYNLNPQLASQELAEGFMAWLQVSFIFATALAGPWLLYQLWQFVAAGLYPHERKYITKYVPLSITLLLSGMVFVYYIVLPLTLRFFILFMLSLPLQLPSETPIAANPSTSSHPTYFEALSADPVNPAPYRVWFNTTENRLKMNAAGAGQTPTIRALYFGGESLLTPHFSLSDYLDLVIRLLLTFGLCFQLPLVVLALAVLGIVEIADLKAMRRYVYFGMTVLAAAVSPGDVITATLALLFPLLFLYEMGIFMARMSLRAKAKAEAQANGQSL